MERQPDIMTRRTALAAMLGAAAAPAATTPLSIDAVMQGASGAALLLDIRTRQLLAVHNAAVAGNVVAPPGSTLKPFALAALLKLGKLSAAERYVCPGKLQVGGRSLNCSHPRTEIPMQVETALAYSCNCFVAHMAERFEPGDLAEELQAAGLASRTGLFGPAEATGRITPASGIDARRLQALGEDGVAVTLAELAMGYRWLAMREAQPDMQAIATGLTAAVEYGTAQRAAVPGMRVAGKTGSVRTFDGERIAWFAGYTPEVVVAVMLQARSGGGDAAPVAARILDAYRKGLAGELKHAPPKAARHVVGHALACPVTPVR
jgi:cell division protein FtsI/penicillin-binding protein 2